ncbi:MAG: class I SAM-dependent methyltransferase [Elusimicrobiota bacterium]
MVNIYKSVFEKHYLEMTDRERAELMAEVFPHRLSYESKNFIRKKFEELRIKHILKLCGDVRNKKILDAGAGDGFILEKIQSSDKWGIDISEKRISRARKRDPKATLRVEDLHKTSFPDNYFDSVICADVIEHVGKPAVMVEEMLRITKDRGFIVFLFPNEIMFIFMRVLNLIFPPLNPDHITWITPSKLNKMMGQRPAVTFNIPDLPYPFCLEQCYRYEVKKP